MHEVACLLITIPFSSFPVILPFFALPRAFRQPARSQNPKDASWSALSKTYPPAGESQEGTQSGRLPCHSLPRQGSPSRRLKKGLFSTEHMYPVLRFPAYPLDANMDRTLLVGNWLWIAYVGCLCWLGWRWSCVCLGPTGDQSFGFLALDAKKRGKMKK